MAESVRIGPKFAVRGVAVAALTLLTVVAPVLAFGGPVPPAAADGGGGYFTCTGISGITHQPIGYTVTMAAGSSGSAYLGGTYISNCELTGTVPSGWTVLQDTSATLDAGSENDGNWTINTDDQTITGAGTFTNTGTITDESDGFTQSVSVPDFVNTGTVASVEGGGNTSSPGLTITGTGTVFENQGVVTSETGGSISFDYATFKLESGGSVAASPGLVGLAEDSTLDVEGGTVTSGAIATTIFLGTTASEVEFGSSVPAGSTGTVNLTSSVTLSGTVPSGWTVNITGGSPTVTPGSGNDGAIVWNDGNSTFADTGTFTNAGTFTDESSGNSQDIAVADFINTGTVTSDSPGFELSGGSSSDLFDNQGAVTVGAGGVVSVNTGTFELDSGGTIAAGGGNFALATNSTFEVAGGSVTSGTVNTSVFLGHGPSNLTFGPSVPAGSTGTIDLTSSITLNGTIPSGWTVDADSAGALTAAPGSGNDGTLVFDGTSQFNGTGTFTNNGSMTAASEMTVDISSFTNGAAGTLSTVAGGYLVFAVGAPPTNLSGGVLTGGSWLAGALMDFNAPFTTDNATMTLTASTGVFATSTYLSFVIDAINTLTTIDSGASLTLQGGSNETVGGSLTNDGTLTLGSNDRLTVDDNLTEGSTATLATTVAGTAASSFGHVTADGIVDLDGTLQLATGGGYVPFPGDTQAIATGAAVHGTFASITGPTQWPTGIWTASYSSHQATVSILSIGLVKSSTTSGYTAAGDTIDYQYFVTNFTEATLGDIAITDSVIPSDAISCPSTTLAPGADETCTASYAVTQADVDAGSVTNIAFVTSNGPNSPEETVTVPASGATASLSLVKSTTTSGYGAAGDTIDYSYLVTNTGTETISDVGVSDNLVSGVNCPQPQLAPGDSETCNGTYTATQSDVDAGSVTNTAQAVGNNPHGTVIDSGTSSVTVEANEATATLSLHESTTAANYTAAGQQVEFDYTVTNTGTTTLDQVSINDSLSVASDPSCQWNTLAPGVAEHCSGTYTTTGADMAAGSITDTAQASATTLHGPATVDSATSSVTVVEQAITTVTFLKTPASPEVMVNGMNLGTRPQAIGACSAGNTDWANGALSFTDTTTFTGSGAPGDCIGLAIVSYSQSAVVFTFGTQYTNYPPLASGDSYTVEVGNATASGTVIYNFPTVFSVSPRSAPGAGGVKVTITGAGMVAPSSVHFGSVRATSWTSNALGTAITAVAPAQAAGTGDVTVTTSGGISNTLAADQFTYLGPTVTSVSPRSGAAAGGNKVTIIGRDLNKASSVQFGSVPATSFAVNAAGTTIAAVAPGQGAGMVDVTVTTAGGTSAPSSADHYTYLAPSVTKVNPSSGPGAGGNTVVISGQALTGATAVLFGTTPAVHYTVNSYGTAITAVAPAGSGAVNVTVTTPGGTSITSAANRYSYLAPRITRVSPVSGSEAGGATVTLTGADFNGASAVRFGSTAGTIVSVNVSGTTITATTPASAVVGPVNVTVTTPGGTSAVSTVDRYSYT